MLFLDIESTGTSAKKDQLHGIAVLENGISNYFLAHEVTQELRYTLADATVPKCGHNVIDFDIPFLRAKGFEINGKIHDTRHMAYLIDENSPTGLKDLIERYFGKEFLSNKAELDRVLSETGSAHVGHLSLKDIVDPERPYANIIAKYAVEDVANTEMLFKELKRRLEDLDIKVKKVFGPAAASPKDIYLNETVPFEAVKLKMQRRGILIDPSRIEHAREQLAKEKLDLEIALYALTTKEQTTIAEQDSHTTLTKKKEKLKTDVAKERLESEPARWQQKFVWTKNHQVVRLLQLLGVRETQFLLTEKGLPSLDKNGIAYLQEALGPNEASYKVIGLYKEYKKINKLITTYVGDDDGGGILDYAEQGRVYPQYGSFQVTGRLSCSSPNVQQLPRNSPVKSFFVPEPGKVFLHFDASQIELRVAAHVSNDPDLIDAYNHGLDLHIMTAEAFFNEKVGKDDERRQVGKTSNFLMIFDGSPKRLQAQLKQAGFNYSEEQCRSFRDAFFARYPGYKQYLKDQLAIMQERRAVFTETGRMRRLQDIALGQHINYRKRELVSVPEELYSSLIHYAKKVVKIQGPVSKAQLFEIASKRYSHAKKQGYNFPIQGLAASILKQGMILLAKNGYELVTTVHDSIDVIVDEKDAEKELLRVEKLLNSCYKLRVPLVWEGKALRSFNEKDAI